MIDKELAILYALYMDESTGSGLLGGVIYLTVVIAYIVTLWKIYDKAGKPGWAALIPFYNLYVLLKIVGRPGWWLVLYLIPIANIVVHLMVSMDLAKVFKKSTAFGIVLLWLFSFVGYLILGFGKSTYTAPTASPTPSAPAIPPTPAAPPPQPTQT